MVLVAVRPRRGCSKQRCDGVCSALLAEAVRWQTGRMGRLADRQIGRPADWPDRWEWIVTPFPPFPPTVPTVLTFFHIVLPTTGDATRRVSSKSQNRAAGPNDRICHGGVHFFAYTYLPNHTVRYLIL